MLGPLGPTDVWMMRAISSTGAGPAYCLRHDASQHVHSNDYKMTLIDSNARYELTEIVQLRTMIRFKNKISTYVFKLLGWIA